MIFSPTVFNVVVDAVIRNQVTVVDPKEAGEEGLRENMQDFTALFYADDELVASDPPTKRDWGGGWSDRSEGWGWRRGICYHIFRDSTASDGGIRGDFRPHPHPLGKLIHSGFTSCWSSRAYSVKWLDVRGGASKRTNFRVQFAHCHV